MKRTKRRNPRPDSNDMREEYTFDYSRAKPNRFASQMNRPVVAVVLEPDVASVFNSAGKVNARLRSAIAAASARNSPCAHAGIAEGRANKQLEPTAPKTLSAAAQLQTLAGRG